MGTQQILPPFSDRLSNSKQLSEICRCLLHSVIEFLAEVGNGVSILMQNRLNSDLGGINFNCQGLGKVRQGEHRGASKYELQL